MALPSQLKATDMNHRSTKATLLMTVTVALALSACSRNDEDRTAGQKLDSAIAKTEQKADEAQAAVKKEVAEAKADAKDASATMDDKSGDAGITVGVNAELAKDSTLSALRINVDTTNGRVTLSGTAPDTTSRDRATSLTQSVKGVVSVDNRLEVRS